MLTKKQKLINKKLRREKSKAFLNKTTKREYKKALIEWSKKIKERDKVCLVCNCSDKQLHPHHLLPKRFFKEYSLEPMNGILLCASHHEFGAFSAHLNAIFFSLWLECVRPEQYEWVRERLGEKLKEKYGLFKPKEKDSLVDLWDDKEDDAAWNVIKDFKEEGNG